MDRYRGIEFVGRLMMAALFLIAGAMKIQGWAPTLGYFTALGFPMPAVVLGLTIALELAGGLALLAGWRVPLVSVLLGLFTLASGCIGHAFWAADAASFVPQLQSFLKNVAIAGGFALLFAMSRERALRNGR